MKEHNDSFAHEYETALNTLVCMQTSTLECKSAQTFAVLRFVSVLLYSLPLTGLVRVLFFFLSFWLCVSLGVLLLL